MSLRIDSLEKQGFVERKPDTDDRRSVFVKLTPKGIALLEVLIPEHFEVMWMKLNLSLQVRPYSLLGAIGRLLGNHYAGAPRSEFVDT